MGEACKRSGERVFALGVALFRTRPSHEQGEGNQPPLEESKDERPKKRSREGYEQPGDEVASLDRTSFDGLRHAKECNLKREA
jgi:hypothetical protein